MAEPKKYYWLKLKKDFFKRHDIQIIESMSNGKDYILFYLKMLVESVDHDGNLRFSNTIPYNEDMLSTITRTNIDIVRSAMKVFTDLKMIEILEDSTIYMAEVEKMLGTETYWAEQKRKQKANKLLSSGNFPPNVHLESNKSNQELEKDIDIDIDKDIIGINPTDTPSKPKKTSKFIPPTLEEVQAYCKERGNNVDAEKFINHYGASNWYRGKTKITNWKACVITWEKGYNNQPPNKSEKSNRTNFEQRDYDDAFFKGW